MGAPSAKSRTMTIIAASVAIALLSACDEPAPPKATIRPVRATLTELLDIGDALSQTGEIQARNQTDLGFRIDGKIIARPVDVGSVVKKDDLIARLDSQATRSQIQSAQAVLTAAEAELTRARAEEARQSALLKDGFTTRQRYDTAVRDLQAAEAQRDSAQAKLSLARDDLGYTELHSDVDGVVTATYAEAGQVVAAGQRVVRIAEPREREAVFDVPEVAFRLIPHDPQIEVTLVTDPSIKIAGRVRYVAPQADPTTRTYAVRISLPDAPPEMRLGATVKGRVELPAQKLVALPSSALFEQDGKPAVWVLDRTTDTVHLKPVTVLRFDPDRVLLSAGVEAGDMVVTAGVHLLRPGEQVRLLAAVE
jgi:membrane fusion protein, multidrug efflux system